MQEIDINDLVNQNNILNENISKDIIIIGKICTLYINYIYDILDLSNIDCNTLYCYYQEGESIKNYILPNNLEELYCYGNRLTSLPDLPNSLGKLYCATNRLTSLPELPNSLKILSCGYNRLTSLPNLPNSLEILYCYNNKLTSLPKLPNSLKRLDIRYVNVNKIEYNPDYKNIKFNLINSEITIGDYIIKSKEDYISYMEDYEKYLFNKVKSARK